MNQTFVGIFPSKSKIFKKINEKKFHISKILKIIIWKDKINYNKIIMSTQNNLIIVTSSAKQRGSHIGKGSLGYLDLEDSIKPLKKAQWIGKDL
jgi:hypothetical protein